MKNEIKEIDHELTDEIVCPYCGHEFSDSYEFEGEDKIICYECNKEFGCMSHIRINYSTKKIKEE